MNRFKYFEFKFLLGNLVAYHLSLIEDFIGFEDEQSAFLFNDVFFYSEHESNGGSTYPSYCSSNDDCSSQLMMGTNELVWKCRPLVLRAVRSSECT